MKRRRPLAGAASPVAILGNEPVCEIEEKPRKRENGCYHNDLSSVLIFEVEVEDDDEDYGGDSESSEGSVGYVEEGSLGEVEADKGDPEKDNPTADREKGAFLIRRAEEVVVEEGTEKEVNEQDCERYEKCFNGLHYQMGHNVVASTDSKDLKELVDLV